MYSNEVGLVLKCMYHCICQNLLNSCYILYSSAWNIFFRLMMIIKWLVCVTFAKQRGFFECPIKWNWVFENSDTVVSSAMFFSTKILRSGRKEKGSDKRKWGKRGLGISESLKFNNNMFKPAFLLPMPRMILVFHQNLNPPIELSGH